MNTTEFSASVGNSTAPRSTVEDGASNSTKAGLLEAATKQAIETMTKYPAWDRANAGIQVGSAINVVKAKGTPDEVCNEVERAMFKLPEIQALLDAAEQRDAELRAESKADMRRNQVRGNASERAYLRSGN